MALSCRFQVMINGNSLVTWQGMVREEQSGKRGRWEDKGRGGRSIDVLSNVHFKCSSHTSHCSSWQRENPRKNTETLEWQRQHGRQCHTDSPVTDRLGSLDPILEKLKKILFKAKFVQVKQKLVTWADGIRQELWSALWSDSRLDRNWN